MKSTDFWPYDKSEPASTDHSAFVRYTAFGILAPVVGAALQAPFGCAGVNVWRDNACMPPSQHPAHIEQHAPLVSTNVLDFRAVVSSGASLSSTAAATIWLGSRSSFPTRISAAAENSNSS